MMFLALITAQAPHTHANGVSQEGREGLEGHGVELELPVRSTGVSHRMACILSYTRGLA